MSIQKQLQASFKQIKALRQFAQIMRRQGGRQPLGYGAKLRMRRAEWIRNSQEQGVAVATDRRVRRQDGTMLEHLKQFYPMHRHGRNAQA